MVNNRIITYSLLAHINNNNKGIIDLCDIFVPIIKRVIYSLTQRGVRKGILSEIKENVDTIYGLDIPYPILKKILRKISFEYNDENSRDFELFRDGSFILNNYIFLDYEEIVLKQQAEIETLTKAYEQYLLANGFEFEKQPTIFEFLDTNRLSLSGFFANKPLGNLEAKYLPQANFVNSVKQINEIYSILKKIYLGSIITSYLEVDFGVVKEKQVEFVLDTNFIINLLNLSSVESNHTCLKIIEICNRLGYKTTILDFTIEEAKVLLNRKAEEFDRVFLIKQIYPDSIYNACARLNLNKTDLHNLANNLEKRLKTEFNIYIVPDTSPLRNKALYSGVYKTLRERKSNPDGALHDSVAILYVQMKRAKKIKAFYDANCWFVTYTKQDNELLERIDGELSEMIKPEDLVNILWLSNPKVKGTEITEVGLTRLVSGTISHSLPNTRVLKEFDENLEKYAAGNIEAQDCIHLANRIANKTIVNLDSYNKVAKESPTDFLSLLNSEINKAKEDDVSSKEKTTRLIIQLKSEFENSIKLREQELLKNYRNELEKLIELHTSKTEKVTLEKEKEIMETQLSEITLSLNSLKSTKEKIDIKVVKFAKRSLISMISIYYIIIILFFYLWGYEFLNNMTVVVAILLFPIPYIFLALNVKVWHPKEIWAKAIESRKNRSYIKHNFDYEHYQILQNKKTVISNKLKYFKSKNNK